MVFPRTKGAIDMAAHCVEPNFIKVVTAGGRTSRNGAGLPLAPNRLLKSLDLQNRPSGRPIDY